MDIDMGDFPEVLEVMERQPLLAAQPEEEMVAVVFPPEWRREMTPV